jgi:hypothetical protein
VGSVPFNYRVTSSEVQVRLGGWVVRRVALGDIERAEIVPSWRATWWNEHWTNFSLGRCVVLRRKSGWIRAFVINPPDPEAFCSALRREAPWLGAA